MSDNKIAIAAAIIGAGYLLTQKKPPPPPPPIIETQSTPEHTPELGIEGIGAIDRTSTPDFETWKRIEWSTFFRDLYENSSEPENTPVIVWDLWNVESNPHREKFPTIEAFIFNLATYRDKSIIGDSAPFVVTADSTPVYETWTNTWGGQPSWDCEQWQQWYVKLAQKLGAQEARDKWANAWSYVDNWGFKWRLTAGQWCGIDCDFINYFRLKGIDVANTGAETTCTLVSIPTNLLDATANITEGAVNVTEGIVDTTSLLKTLVPLVFVGGVALFAYKKINE